MLRIQLKTAISIILVVALAGAVDTGNSVRADEAGDAWAVSKMTRVEKGKRKARGFALYTTADKALGAAFRCDDDRLVVFVAVMPVNMYEIMTGFTRNPHLWNVTFSVEGGEQREEEWISMFGGKVFMARSNETSREIFEAARDGAEIDFVRPYGKPLKLSIPADSGEQFDRFERHCEFSEEEPATVDAKA